MSEVKRGGIKIRVKGTDRKCYQHKNYFQKYKTISYLIDNSNDKEMIIMIQVDENQTIKLIDKTANLKVKKVSNISNI